MATGNRTLKLSILADVDDLKKKLGEADKRSKVIQARFQSLARRLLLLLLLQLLLPLPMALN